MLRISQNLSLQQKMAPQLIQSLQLLQMSTLDLEMEIKQQMELNPLLEEGMDQEEFFPQDASLITRAILGAINGTVRWYRPTGALKSEAVAETYTTYLLRGLLR